MKPKERVLIISDTQAPFHHKDTIEFLKEVKRTYKPTKIVHIGDIIDFHALSGWVTNPNGRSAGDELNGAVNFVKELGALFPKLTVTLGNHDIRAYKKAMKAGIPQSILKGYREFLQAPKGWDFVDKVTIDDVTYIHGNQVASGGGNIMMNGVKKYMKNIVFGHFHTRFGIDWHANEDSLMFGMCVGCLIDHKSYAFEYCAQSPRKPIIGVGLVDKGAPRLVPMFLKKNGRWDKKKQ